MVVYLKTGSWLRERLNPDVDYYTRRVEVPEGTSVKEILKAIGLDPTFVAFICTRNKVEWFDYIPRDGEIITLQPPVSGG